MHGDATSAEHHPGDFGNLTVGSEGTGVKDLTVSGLTLAAGQQMSVGNLSVIVHEKQDDFSQPTGNAGARQACGIILVK
jgi:Cu-Zn family superoxide dismutase